MPLVLRSGAYCATKPLKCSSVDYFAQRVFSGPRSSSSNLGRKPNTLGLLLATVALSQIVWPDVSPRLTDCCPVVYSCLIQVHPQTTFSCNNCHDSPEFRRLPEVNTSKSALLEGTFLNSHLLWERPPRLSHLCWCFLRTYDTHFEVTRFSR